MGRSGCVEARAEIKLPAAGRRVRFREPMVAQVVDGHDAAARMNRRQDVGGHKQDVRRGCQ